MCLPYKKSESIKTISYPKIINGEWYLIEKEMNDH